MTNGKRDQYRFKRGAQFGGEPTLFSNFGVVEKCKHDNKTRSKMRTGSVDEHLLHVLRGGLESRGERIFK